MDSGFLRWTQDDCRNDEYALFTTVVIPQKGPYRTQVIKKVEISINLKRLQFIFLFCSFFTHPGQRLLKITKITHDNSNADQNKQYAGPGYDQQYNTNDNYNYAQDETQ